MHRGAHQCGRRTGDADQQCARGGVAGEGETEDGGDGQRRHEAGDHRRAITDPPSQLVGGDGPDQPPRSWPWGGDRTALKLALAPVIALEPVGVVVGGRGDAVDDDWGGVEAVIRLDGTRFGPDAVRGLGDFSHLVVVFQFHLVGESEVQTGARRPRGNPDWPEVGMFAQRARMRPNRLGVSACVLVARRRPRPVRARPRRRRRLARPRRQALHEGVRTRRRRCTAAGLGDRADARVLPGAPRDVGPSSGAGVGLPGEIARPARCGVRPRGRRERCRRGCRGHGDRRGRRGARGAQGVRGGAPVRGRPGPRV